MAPDDHARPSWHSGPTLFRMAVFVLAAVSWSASEPRASPSQAKATVVFPVELADTSGELPRAGRPAQIAATTEALTEALERSGEYRRVDLAPIRNLLAAASPLHRCDGCWIDLAQRAAAEVAAITVVHKKSTLVSSMHVWMVDVAARRVIRKGAVSLRGDTEESWRRAAGYLARNVLLNDAADHPSLSSPFPGG